MVEFSVIDKKIELMSYSSNDTLVDLARSLEKFRLSQDLKTRYCYNCGECCNQPIPVMGYDFDALSKATGYGKDDLVRNVLRLPDPPDPAQRKKAVEDLKLQHNFSELEATLLYEYNQSEPIILDRKEDGACVFLNGKLCTIYENRPYMCWLHLCNMGDKLEIMYEMIIGQGIWLAYHKMGWVDAEELTHNPFLVSRSYEDVRMADFEFDLEAAREKLFFYF